MNNEPSLLVSVILVFIKNIGEVILQSKFKMNERKPKFEPLNTFGTSSLKIHRLKSYT